MQRLHATEHENEVARLELIARQVEFGDFPTFHQFGDRFGVKQLIV